MTTRRSMLGYNPAFLPRRRRVADDPELYLDELKNETQVKRKVSDLERLGGKEDEIVGRFQIRGSPTWARGFVLRVWWVGDGTWVQKGGNRPTRESCIESILRWRIKDLTSLETTQSCM